jgi:hypothetical protein
MPFSLALSLGNSLSLRHPLSSMHAIAASTHMLLLLLRSRWQKRVATCRGVRIGRERYVDGQLGLRRWRSVAREGLLWLRGLGRRLLVVGVVDEGSFWRSREGMLRRSRVHDGAVFDFSRT